MITWTENVVIVDQMIISNITTKEPSYIETPKGVEIKYSKTNENLYNMTITINNVSKYLNNHKWSTLFQIEQGEWDLLEYYPLTKIDNKNEAYLSEFVFTLHRGTVLLTMRIPYKTEDNHAN